MSIRVIELFAGIGAQASALERLGIEHERVAVAEFNDAAYKVYCALHGDTPNLGDVTKIEHLPECDLLTYSSPCQDISIAGHKAGLQKGSGTRSATLWDVGRLLEDMKERNCLPEVLLMENVDSILFKHARPDFDMWVRELEDLGYTNSFEVLNAKDHGVPQNRKRMFMVSTLTLGKFEFPKPRPLTKRLKDVLEEDVPESFYLSDERIANYERSRKAQEEKGNGFGVQMMDVDKEKVAHTVVTHPSKDAGNIVILPNGQSEPGLKIAGDLHKDGYLDIMNRVYDQDGISPTIHTCAGGGMVPKVDVTDEPRIEVEGILPKLMMDRGGQVYNPNGVSPSVLSRDGKGPIRIEVAVLKSERTEYGKAIRSEYEKGNVKESRHNMTQLVPRDDGLSNTLTTVPKDNIVVESPIRGGGSQ